MRPALVSDENQPASVQSVARQMFDQSNGDMNAAADKFAGYVANFPGLIKEALRIAGSKLIGEIPQMERRAIEMQEAADSAPPFYKAPHRMNDGALRTQERVWKNGLRLKDAWLNAPYTIGSFCKPLRDWVGTEVLAHAETQLLSGSTQVRNARYLIAVGEAAGNRKIGYALKEEDLVRLRAEALATAV